MVLFFALAGWCLAQSGSASAQGTATQPSVSGNAGVGSANASGTATEQGAGQDMKDAAHDTAHATKKTAHKVAHGAKKGVHKGAHGVKKGARKVEHKTDTTPHNPQ